MPDIDTDTAKRLKYKWLWIRLAAKHGVRSGQNFSQAELLTANTAPGQSLGDGWCFGLSAVHLIRKRGGDASYFRVLDELTNGLRIIREAVDATGWQEARAQKIFGEAEVARFLLDKTYAAKQQLFSAQAPLKQLNDDVTKLHNAQRDKEAYGGVMNVGNSKYRAEERDVRAKRELTAAGLAHQEHRHFDAFFSRNTELAKYLATVDPSYCLIQTPNHALASVVRGGSFSFFDPNFGEVTFGNAKHFQEFVQDYFNDDGIRRSYRGTKRRHGKEVAHNTLKFTVDRYQ